MKLTMTLTALSLLSASAFAGTAVDYKILGKTPTSVVIQTSQTSDGSGFAGTEIFKTFASDDGNSHDSVIELNDGTGDETLNEAALVKAARTLSARALAKEQMNPNDKGQALPFVTAGETVSFKIAGKDLSLTLPKIEVTDFNDVDWSRRLEKIADVQLKDAAGTVRTFTIRNFQNRSDVMSLTVTDVRLFKTSLLIVLKSEHTGFEGPDSIPNFLLVDLK